MVSNARDGSSGSQGTEAYQKPFFQDLWSQGQDLMNQVGQNPQLQNQLGGLFGQGQQLQQNLQNNPYMQDQYTPSQAYEQQLAAGGQAINQATGMAMHGANQMGISAGGYGGSRGQVAKGLIGQGGVNSYAQLSGQLMGQDMQNQLGQAGLYAQSQLGGLGALQGQAGVAQQQAQAPWMGLMNQGQLIGGAQGSGTESGSGSKFSVANK